MMERKTSAFECRAAQIERHRRESRIRRIKLVLAAFSIIFAVLGSGNFLLNADAKTSVTYEKLYKNIQIKQGDSLYSIAQEYSDDVHYTELRDYMDEVIFMNNLSDPSCIKAGGFLMIPVYQEVVL